MFKSNDKNAAQRWTVWLQSISILMANCSYSFLSLKMHASQMSEEKGGETPYILLKICQCPGWQYWAELPPWHTQEDNESTRLLNDESYSWMWGGLLCSSTLLGKAPEVSHHQFVSHLHSLWHLEVDNKKPFKLICNQNLAVLIEQMSTGWPFSLLNDEERSSWTPTRYVH